MVRILSRSLALVFAVTLVGVAGWSFAQPYLFIYLVRWEPTIIDVFGTPEVASSAWLDLEAGAFHLKVPLGTKVTSERHDAFGQGRIVHPTFALAYHFGPGTDDQSALRQAVDYREEALLIDGHAAVLRRAFVPGSAEPWRLALYIEKAGRWRGAPLALELHGSFASEYQREMAATVLKSLRVKDPPDSLLTVEAYVFDRDMIVVP